MNHAKPTDSPIPRRRPWRCILITILCVAAIYVGSYAANSSLGGYWLRPERDGNHRWKMGLSLHDAILWQPAYGYCARYNSDFLGSFYTPLVALDRAWFHPTMYVLEESTFEWINRKARASDIHPGFRDEFTEAKNKMNATPSSRQ